MFGRSLRFRNSRLEIYLSRCSAKECGPVSRFAFADADGCLRSKSRISDRKVRLRVKQPCVGVGFLLSRGKHNQATASVRCWSRHARVIKASLFFYPLAFTPPRTCSKYSEHAHTRTPTTITLCPLLLVVLAPFADDRHKHVAAVGAGSRRDACQPGHLHADRQGPAVRLDGLDGNLGQRLPQGSVAGPNGRHEIVENYDRLGVCKRGVSCVCVCGCRHVPAALAWRVL